MAMSAPLKVSVLLLTGFLLTSCLGPDDVIGHYVPLIPEASISETLLVAGNHQFRYKYSAGTKTFVHMGTWELESRQGHDYLVMRDWQMLRSRCGMEKPSIASFDIDK